MSKADRARTGMRTVGRLAVRKDGTVHPAARSTLLRLLHVQRPIVLAYVRQIRRRNPDASPAEVIAIMEGHYRWIATGGGAAVGASAAIPGIGTGAALLLATAETGGFLEGSALFSQAVAEVHGLAVEDPERANLLVMGVMLGKAGRDLLRDFGQEKRPGAETWGSVIATQVPNAMLAKMVNQFKRALIRRYASRQGGALIGKILPFGIGAVIGGAANRSLSGGVIKHAREAFGPAPVAWPEHLLVDLDDKRQREGDRDLLGGLKHVISLIKKRRGDGDDPSGVIIPGEVVDAQGDDVDPGELPALAAEIDDEVRDPSDGFDAARDEPAADSAPAQRTTIDPKNLMN